MTAGWFTRALATATLCFSPPDSSAGLWLALSAKPMNRSNSLALWEASALPLPAMKAGIMTFSRAVNSGSSWWNWNTKPRRWLRKSLRRLPESLPTSTPSMVMVPESGLSSVPMICRSVVLPAPDGPTMLTISPAPTCRSMPLSTCSEPKLLVMFLISIMSDYLTCFCMYLPMADFMNHPPITA